jgi:glucosyl-3-phosphoglycerate synthase
MADFYQNGIVTTLHNLTNRGVEELENELVEFSKTRPMGLILPSLYSELEGEALPKIVEHISEVPYLSQVIIGLDRATEDEFCKAIEFF